MDGWFDDWMSDRMSESVGGCVNVRVYVQKDMDEEG